MHIGTDAQILCHHEYDAGSIENTWWYVPDRLGSVRQVFTYDSSDVAGENTLTYEPFGNLLEDFKAAGATDKPFKFTGQWAACPEPSRGNEEIDQYYLRARMYDPTMMRFTTRDPASGSMEEPRTLHKYLYCINSPRTYVDLNGEEFSLPGLLSNTGIGARLGGVSAYMGTGGDWSATAVGVPPFR